MEEIQSAVNVLLDLVNKYASMPKFQRPSNWKDEGTCFALLSTDPEPDKHIEDVLDVPSQFHKVCFLCVWGGGDLWYVGVMDGCCGWVVDECTWRTLCGYVLCVHCDSNTHIHLKYQHTPQALHNNETLYRLHKNAPRYKEALEEIQALNNLCSTEEGFTKVPALSMCTPLSVFTQQWWQPAVHNEALLKGCMDMGYIPASASRRAHVVGVLGGGGCFGWGWVFWVGGGCFVGGVGWCYGQYAWYTCTTHTLDTRTFNTHTRMLNTHTLDTQLKNIIMDTCRGFPTILIGEPENSKPPHNNNNNNNKNTNATTIPTQPLIEKQQEGDNHDTPAAAVASPQPPTAPAPPYPTKPDAPPDSTITMSSYQVNSMVNDLTKHVKNLFRFVVNPSAPLPLPPNNQPSEYLTHNNNTNSSHALPSHGVSGGMFSTMWAAAQQSRPSNTMGLQQGHTVGAFRKKGNAKQIIGADLLGKPREASQAYTSSGVAGDGDKGMMVGDKNKVGEATGKDGDDRGDDKAAVKKVVVGGDDGGSTHQPSPPAGQVCVCVGSGVLLSHVASCMYFMEHTNYLFQHTSQKASPMPQLQFEPSTHSPNVPTAGAPTTGAPTNTNNTTATIQHAAAATAVAAVISLVDALDTHQDAPPKQPTQEQAPTRAPLTDRNAQGTKHAQSGLQPKKKMKQSTLMHAWGQTG